MRWVNGCVVVVAVSSTFLTAQVASAEPAKATVEIRWVESKPIDGVTEAEGYQTSCDPKSVMYPHKKPALVLTAAEVSEVELKQHDLSNSGLSGANFMVNIHLTKEARDKLAATCEGDEMRLLTIMIDDKPWGLYRYEKDKEKKFVPDAARAETFAPGVGFFSSRFQASRVVNALK